MTPAEWKTLKHFKPTENWGDPSRMDLKFMQELDAFREYVNTPILIHCGTQGEHVEGSAHYMGIAADLEFPKLTLAGLLDMWIAAQRFQFGGIGLYPGWRGVDGEIRGGLHLDGRKGRRALWMREPTPMQTYIAVNVENLRKYRLI